jgi:outer membrane lipoprotein LolB
MPFLATLFNSLHCAVCVLALSLFMAGCATVKTPAESGMGTSSGERRASARSYHEAIDLSGRLSARYQQNGSDQAVHGSFTWAQSTERTVVTLFSPLGQTIAVINIAPDLSTLTQSGQSPRTASDVDALAAGALGWPLPLSGLRNWLQGFAHDADGRHFIAMPQAGLTSVTTADGWRINYSNWQDNGVEHYPRRIDLERSTIQAGNVALRIAIDTWEPR